MNLVDSSNGHQVSDKGLLRLPVGGRAGPNHVRHGDQVCFVQKGRQGNMENNCSVAGMAWVKDILFWRAS